MISTARLQGILRASHLGCYAIAWQLADDNRLRVTTYYNPEWRLEELKSEGTHGVYTTASTDYSFAPGEGFVGKTFASQELTFVADLEALTENEIASFTRAELAKQYGIRSAVFIPVPGGVIEVGSAQKCACSSNFLSKAVLDAIQKDAPLPAASAGASAMPKGKSSRRLEKLVENACGGCYGIEWALAVDGVLKFSKYYTPQWHIEELRSKGIQSLYSTASADYAFGATEGFVGKVFDQQTPLFVEDLQALADQEVASTIFQGKVPFARVELAKQYGIHSAIFLPLHTGVIEVGSTLKLQTADDLLQASLCATLADIKHEK